LVVGSALAEKDLEVGKGLGNLAGGHAGCLDRLRRSLGSAANSAL
jgi:hypothetical protein